VFYVSLARAVALPVEPLVIPLHRLQSGALLLFTFFMISDRGRRRTRRRTDSFAMLVAYGAWYVQFDVQNERASGRGPSSP
jgi:hypothetical protein